MILILIRMMTSLMMVVLVRVMPMLILQVIAAEGEQKASRALRLSFSLSPTRHYDDTYNIDPLNHCISRIVSF